MANKRKPTMNEMKTAVTNVIKHMSYLQSRIDQLDSVMAGYLEFKSDHKKFPSWFKDKVDKQKEKDEQSKVSESSTGNKKVSSGKK
tara:strand:- start:593 stop:850 length:258 start_codon:yes stop_codon:yes gene_type:complete